MFPIRMKSTGIEPAIYIQSTQTCSRARIPHLQGVVIRGRDDVVSRRADRTPSHLTPMPTKRANQRRVRQVRQRVPACQVWARDFLLECLAQVREIFQISESVIEDRS